GSVRQLDPRLTAERKLATFIYGMDPTGAAKTHAEVMARLQELGFRVNPNYEVYDSIDSVLRYIEAWREQRHDLDYGTDGVVIKAGDVIPEVIGPVLAKRPKNARKWKMPTRCTACGTETVREAGEAVRRCVNPECPSRILESTFHFVSRAAMNIDSLGYQTI